MNEYETALLNKHLLDEALNLMKEFCTRVEAGEVRSRQTYAKFKVFIAKAEAENV